MNYDDFRAIWHTTFRTSGLDTSPLWPQETVDLRTMDRTYSIILHWQGGVQRADNFYITARLSWDWNSLLSARFSTTEEDMLMQIYGDFDIHEDTEQPWLRVDVSLNATLPYDHPMPLPYESTWHRWVGEVHEQILPIFQSEEDEGETLSWCGTPEAEFQCGRTGELFLQGVKLPAFQGIRLPRQWDHPDKWDRQPDEQLLDFFGRVKDALLMWDNSLRFLRSEIT